MQNCMLQGCVGTGGMSLSVGVDKWLKSAKSWKIAFVIQTSPRDIPSGVTARLPKEMAPY